MMGPKLLNDRIETGLKATFVVSNLEITRPSYPHLMIKERVTLTACILRYWGDFSNSG